MPSNVIRVSLLADARDFQGGFRKGERAAQDLQAKVNSFAGNLAADLTGKALSAVKDFAGDSIRAFSDLEQAQGGTQAIFGESAAAVEDMAARSADALGLSEAQFRTATTSIGGQLKRMTGDVEYAADQSVMLTGVAADLAATYGGTTAEAVQALGAAFRGEADPAERFNLNLKVSAVQAKAVEMGLAASTAEVDDHARAQATVALILEQSADAQGQFARESDTVAGKTQRLTAELENQKAALGEKLAPVWMQFLEMGNDLLPVLADVITRFGWLTGAVNDAEKAIADFERVTGRQPETLKDLAVVVNEVHRNTTAWWKTLDEDPFRYDRVEAFQGALEDLFDTVDDKALVEMRDRLEDVADELGLTEDETAALAEAIDRKLSASMAASADRAMMGKFKPALEAAADATEDLADEAEDAEASIQSMLDTTRAAIEPAFGYMKAQANLAAAQQAYNDAVEEFGENSPEAVEAANDIAAANNDIQASVAAIGEQGVPAAVEALKALGVPESVITGFAADRRRIEEIFRNLKLRIGVTAPSLFPTKPASGGVGWQSETRTYYARGGIARARPGGQDAVVAEAGVPEGVIPLNSEGVEFLAATMAAAMRLNGAGGQPRSGGPAVYVTVNAGMGTDGYQVGKQIVEAIQQYVRLAGPVHVGIRTE